MTVTPETFPRWLAGIAMRRVDAATHRDAIVKTMAWHIGPHAAAVLAAANAHGEADTSARRAKSPRHGSELAIA